jgi:hypothetical protein
VKLAKQAEGDCSMKIDDDHLYHGAALNQIAEDPHFTAINALPSGSALTNTYRINDNIGVHLKYATNTKGTAKEYQFTFSADHLRDLASLGNKVSKMFVAMVCVKDRHICCLTLAQLQHLIVQRRKAMARDEEQYVVLVTLPEGKSFRVYVSVPGKRGLILGKELLVPRNCFPGGIF